jgi:hypothetical protein
MTFSLTPRKYALLVQCCSQKMKHCIHIQIKLRVNTRTYFCYKDEVHYIEKVLKFTCDIIRCLLNIPSRKHKNAFVVRNTWVIQQAYIPHGIYMIHIVTVFICFLLEAYFSVTNSLPCCQIHLIREVYKCRAALQLINTSKRTPVKWYN